VAALLGQDKTSVSHDRQMRFYDRVLLADSRPWVCAQATGHTLEVAIGTGLNLPLYPAAVELHRHPRRGQPSDRLRPPITRPLLEACVATCKSCSDECALHAPLPALPGLRTGLPPLRASLPGAAGCPEIADRRLWRPARRIWQAGAESSSAADMARLRRRGFRLEYATITWMAAGGHASACRTFRCGC
jgi:hypothetical protein